jgi:hypothetical protein
MSNSAMSNSAMSAITEYARLAVRLPFALRRFLRQKLTLEEARRTVEEGMARRTDNFLQVVKQGIFANPSSPYRAKVATLYQDNHIWHPEGTFSAESVQANLDFLIAAKALPPGLIASQVADISFLEAVRAEMAR